MNKFNIYYKSYLSIIPILIFITGAIYLGLSGAPNETGYWPIVLFSILIGLFLSKDKNQFATSFLSGISNNVVSIMLIAWLLAGATGSLIKDSGALDVLIHIVINLNMSTTSFLIVTFFISSIVATSTGTAVGTILIITPLLFPAGMAVNCDPYWLLGMILAGGAFGDDFSPISDTTIASSKTQDVDIHLSVKSRLKYALTGAVSTILIVFLFAPVQEHSIISHTSHVVNLEFLWIFVGILSIIIMSLRGVNIVVSLLYGIAIISVVGLVVGAISLNDLFSIDTNNYTANSIIIDGMEKAVGISVFSILLIGLVSTIIESGIVHQFLDNVLIKSLIKKHAEFVIVISTIIFNTLLAHNTITILSIGSIVKKIGEVASVDKLRRSNLLDISGNTVMHIFPYMITVILASSSANEYLSHSGQTVESWKVGFFNFHSISLLIIILLVSIFGIWKNKDIAEH